MQVYYKSSFKENLKIQFHQLDLLTENFSNLCQDLFVLSVLEGKTQGTYLEIGGELPVIGNNTYLLESVYGWKGVSIELNPKYLPMWNEQRKNPLYIADALTIDYSKLLNENNLDTVIDYLSCDIEPQDATLKALQKIDHTQYRFKVITFEHDHYNGGTGPQTRDESRKFLSSLGYDLLVGDVSHQGCKIEDWWVAPELVNKEVCDKLRLVETWNADETVYLNPISHTLKHKRPAVNNNYSLDQGYISFL